MVIHWCRIAYTALYQQQIVARALQGKSVAVAVKGVDISLLATKGVNKAPVDIVVGGLRTKEKLVARRTGKPIESGFVSAV